MITRLTDNHFEDVRALIPKDPAVPTVIDTIEIIVCELNPALLAIEENSAFGPSCACPVEDGFGIRLRWVIDKPKLRRIRNTARAVVDKVKCDIIKRCPPNAGFQLRLGGVNLGWLKRATVIMVYFEGVDTLCRLIPMDFQLDGSHRFWM